MNSWCTLLNAFCFVCGTYDPIPHEKQSRTFVKMFRSLKKGFSNFFCYLCCWNTRAEDVDHCIHKWDPTQKVTNVNKKLLQLQSYEYLRLKISNPNVISQQSCLYHFVDYSVSYRIITFLLFIFDVSRPVHLLIQLIFIAVAVAVFVIVCPT